MRQVVFTLTAVAIIFAARLTCAQETADDENLEYQKLKVLEPLVGEYHTKWSSEENEMKWESLMTLSWSDSKKMLLEESRMRNAPTDAELSKQELELGPRSYYVWNHNAKRIEYVSVRPFRGKVATCEVKSQGNGVFTYTRVGTTVEVDAAEMSKTTMTVTVTDEDLTAKFSDWTNDAGEVVEGRKFVFPRAKADE